MRLLFIKDEETLTHLSIIERSYSAGVVPEYGFSFLRHEDPATFTGFSEEVAKAVASFPERYPMEIIGAAEAFCKEAVASTIVPVGEIARRDKWFSE
jgi:hypothetical protein